MPLLRHTPALIWRAFFMGGLLVTGLTQAAPPGTATAPSTYLQFGLPDQAEGRRVLETFRQAGIPGQYYLGFDLRGLPRRGDESVLKGRLWGSRNEQGAITRMTITMSAGVERRLLIQNGGQSKVWSTDTGGAAHTTRIVDAFDPLVPGVQLTAFELQMPYLYWPDATLERLVRIRNRPSHAFFFRPPAAWAALHPEISGVRAYLDTQFNVPVQTELIGQKRQVLRTLSLVDLTKVSGQYIPKTVDLRDETTRDKVRFQVTGAALDLALPAAMFEPGQLGEDVASPDPGRIVRVAP
jgi:hypothetical protein